MKHKIWLDATHEMPEPTKNDPKSNFTTWCKTAEEALNLIKKKSVEYISFSHDLGDGKNGYWLACKIEDLAYFGKINAFGWAIHSTNISRAENIRGAMTRACGYWKRDGWYLDENFCVRREKNNNAHKALFSVTIVETICKSYSIRADSEDDALEEAKDLYTNGAEPDSESKLDNPDFSVAKEVYKDEDEDVQKEDN